MKPFTLNIRGNLLRVERPMIMGIINVTPDSFWEGSRAADADSIAGRAATMIADGVDIIDLGACSTRPGAETCDAATEEARIAVGIEAVRSVSADIPLSVDTFRASVARSAVEHGADIVNDISGGDLDPEMMPTVASLHVPYIMMHMRGTPATMQSMCDYPEGVVTEVVADLSRKIERFRLAGVADIIADPGLGFAKTVGQNYELLRATAEIEDLLGTSLAQIDAYPAARNHSSRSPRGYNGSQYSGSRQRRGNTARPRRKSRRRGPRDCQSNLSNPSLSTMLTAFTLRDLLDVLLMGLLLFYLYRMMRESGTINIFYGILAFLGVWVLASQILEMKLIGSVLDKFMSIGLLVLVIIFQDQIKRFLVELGDHKRWRFLRNLFHHSHDDSEARNRKYVLPIVYACMNMAKSKTGALIVIQEEVPLDQYEKTGDMIDARINTRLIENIFFKNSPLHDGALIIADGRIKAAGCILPVSHDVNVPRSLGLRHRSALGIAQATDAFAIVVSEETGNISMAHRGKLTTRLSTADLEHRLSQALSK